MGDLWVDDFIQKCVKSDYTEFEKKNDCLVVYPDKKLKSNEYYQFPYLDIMKKTISKFGDRFDGKYVSITKEYGFYVVQMIQNDKWVNCWNKKMCGCKREIKNFNSEIYSGYNFDTVRIDIYNHFLLIELKKNGKQSGWLDLKINYCPFCGEKLND